MRRQPDKAIAFQHLVQHSKRNLNVRFQPSVGMEMGPAECKDEPNIVGNRSRQHCGWQYE